MRSCLKSKCVNDKKKLMSDSVYDKKNFERDRVRERH
jgi:hypothetical protein